MRPPSQDKEEAQEAQALRLTGLAAALALVLALVPAAPAGAVPDCAVGAGAPRDVLTGLGVLEAVAADHDGRLYISDMGGGRILRLDRPGEQPKVLTSFASPGGLAWDADGTLVAGYGNGIAQGVADNGQAGLNRVDPDTGATTAIVQGLGMANGVVRGPDGSVYVTNTFGKNDGRIDRVRDGKVDVAWSPVKRTNGLAIDRAGENLYASDSFAARVIRIPIARPAEFETYAAAGGDDDSAGLDGLAIDGAGRLYVAANLGGEVWRIDSPDRICALARGIQNPGSVGFGGGGAGFPAANLYVVTFTGRLIEIPNATDAPPPAGAPLRLRLSVSPRRAPAGRATRFTLTVTATDRGRVVPVAGATVRLAGIRARTDESGRATIVRRVVHPRLLPANTSKPGYEPGRKHVRVR